MLDRPGKLGEAVPRKGCLRHIQALFLEDCRAFCMRIEPGLEALLQFLYQERGLIVW